MILCIPITNSEKGLNAEVFNHFGSAKYFLIYNLDNKDYQIIDNKNKDHEHGQCKPAFAIEGYNVNAVLTSGMGGRAVMKLNDKGIIVYLNSATTVTEAIEKFKNNELSELKVENACSHHGGCDH